MRSVGADATSLDDLRLLQRVVGGDVEAFDRLYRRHHGRLVGLVTRLTRRPDLAEDVTNEAMLVLWRRADSFRGAARVSTWLCGIAYRLALKRLGQAERHTGSVDLDDVDLVEPTSPETLAGAAQLGRHLRAALDDLAPAQRAVVELTFFHGCSQEEIARLLDCPEGTVKSRMFHARQRLRHILEDRLDGDMENLS
ncbi:MAG: sigma-70 family RNA polymerase sigma factor [Pseudomonadota bacterium]